MKDIFILQVLTFFWCCTQCTMVFQFKCWLMGTHCNQFIVFMSKKPTGSERVNRTQIQHLNKLFKFKFKITLYLLLHDWPIIWIQLGWYMVNSSNVIKTEQWTEELGQHAIGKIISNSLLHHYLFRVEKRQCGCTPDLNHIYIIDWQCNNIRDIIVRRARRQRADSWTEQTSLHQNPFSLYNLLTLTSFPVDNF